ncbi:hypothetical protein FBD94_20295 [Pedobacter hiemivivus]|uniref:Uncharacterized protein n=1 Tax=Pedobacter hiemivivus TaxID=2530454 RepID=A0A4U1G4S2_9SPHI|nr:hypothetical protein [Pedobacter hiemivivus]TKC57620.1 hypothetical protein FBD94_20295 [Pedobacter hiemivivus]
MSSKTNLQYSQLVNEEMRTFCWVNNHSTYFNLFVESLVLKFKPLQIFCFSKETVLEEVQSYFNEGKVKQQCNYCLLLVTESTNRIDHEVQDCSNAHFKLGKVLSYMITKGLLSELQKLGKKL